MNRKPWKSLAAIAAFAVLAPAHAQMRFRGGPEPRGDMERGAAQQQMAPPQNMQPRQDFVQQGRLSPEERRQLRRDIHEAGRELYRRGPPQQHPAP